MHRYLAAAFLVFLSGPLLALDLPVLVREAVVLELEGRLGEALDRYRVALASEDALVGDPGASKPLTVLVLSKAAHLSVDLGYGEEAWDLSGRLVSSSHSRAVAQGTLVRMRALRLQGRTSDALNLYRQFRATWPQAAPDSSLGYEARRLGDRSASPGTSGPWAWVSSGAWAALPSASEALGLTVQETSRLQVGAFQDWGNALTLIDMLREKGWVPFTEVRTAAGGAKLHVVYVVSRQPESDRARLEAQGLTDLP